AAARLRDTSSTSWPPPREISTRDRPMYRAPASWPSFRPCSGNGLLAHGVLFSFSTGRHAATPQEGRHMDRHDSESGRIGYLVLYLMGVPVGVLILLWVLLGNNIFAPG